MRYAGVTDDEMNESWDEMFPDYQPRVKAPRNDRIAQAVTLHTKVAKAKARGRKRYNPLTRRME